MRFFRVGDKVISREKLFEMVSEILSERERGATQEEAAASHGVQRSFISFLESLGEVRRGSRVGLVGFPIANAKAVEELAERYALEYVLVLSQEDRDAFEAGSPADVFNRVLETLAELSEYDVLILIASDWRIGLMEKILGREVVPMSLGASPLTQGVEVDLVELEGVLEGVAAMGKKTRKKRERARKASTRKGATARRSAAARKATARKSAAKAKKAPGTPGESSPAAGTADASGRWGLSKK